MLETRSFYIDRVRKIEHLEMCVYIIPSHLASGLENYVADPGQGALNQRLISRNTSWHEQEKHDVVTLLVVRAGDRGSPQVILEPNIIEPGRG